jgi:hypothetical protein
LDRKDSIALGEGRSNAFIVFPKRRKEGDCWEIEKVLTEWVMKRSA